MTEKQARRYVRARLADWLRNVGAEPPDAGYPPEVDAVWMDEVIKIANRISPPPEEWTPWKPREPQ